MCSTNGPTTRFQHVTEDEGIPIALPETGTFYITKTAYGISTVKRRSFPTLALNEPILSSFEETFVEMLSDFVVHFVENFTLFKFWLKKSLHDS